MRGLNNSYALSLLLVCACIALVFFLGEGHDTTKVADPLIRNNGGAGDFPQ